jgi:hypothetical protein
VGDHRDLSGVGILKASEQRREQKEKKHENISCDYNTSINSKEGIGGTRCLVQKHYRNGKKQCQGTCHI